MTEPQINRPRTEPPTMAEIGRYWEAAQDRGDLFPRLRERQFGWNEAVCFRCCWVPPSKNLSDYPEWWDLDKALAAVWKASMGWLERAHLHDHVFGGSAEPSNLVPLCVLCHEDQPECKTREEGIAFVNSECLRGDPKFRLFFQVATAQLGSDRQRPTKERALRTMLRAQAKASEFVLAQKVELD